MTALVPCSSCARHVRTEEHACPFCGSSIARVEPPRARDVLGVSRAMLLAGATVLAACGKEPAPPNNNDHGNMQTLYGGPPQPLDTSAPAPAYGAPPEMLSATPEPLRPPDAGKADAGKPKK